MQQPREIRHLVPDAGYTVAHARSVGVSRARLYRRDLQRPFRGVRSHSADLDNHVKLCEAFSARMQPGEYFSHSSAAILHELPIPAHVVSGNVEVAVFLPQRPPKMRGVVSHELAATGHRVVRAQGLPCIAPEDVWAQLSNRLPIPDLVAIGDYLITGDEPYSGIPSALVRTDLERAVRHHGRRRGVQSLRQAFELVRFGSLSPQESRLRVALVEAGLPEPESNYRVHDDGGRFVAMVDLAYPARRIAIEYLGDIHRTDRELYQSDIARRERLAEAGWTPVFLTSADLHPVHPRAVPTIRAALSSNRAQAFSPLERDLG